MTQPGADVLVVGAGAAGCLVARHAAEASEAQVFLLEAGPDLRDRTPPEWRDGWQLPTIPDWGYAAEPNGPGAGTTLRRGRLLGGTSWLTRFGVRGVAADYDAWPSLKAMGWSFEDVLPAFRDLEDDLEFGHAEWHGHSGPIPITRYPDLQRTEIHSAALDAVRRLGFPAVDDHNRPDAVGVGPMPMSSRDGIRVTSVDAFLAPAGLPPNLRIRVDAPVASVMVERSRARGVRLVDGEEIPADAVILCAGTYGSPLILMRSGIGPAAQLTGFGMEVLADLPGVGENLADHPGVEANSGWEGRGTKGEVLHSIATFRSSLTSVSSAPDLMFWFSDPSEPDPSFYIDPILLKPRSRGTVRLRSADPLVAPRITLPGIGHQADLERLREGYGLALEIINAPELRGLCQAPPPAPPATPAELTARLRENAYSIPHVVGTCRMGESPDAGAVVDPMGRVHGIAGLGVIDASIIPEPPAGFPHLITLMVAARLSAAHFGGANRRE